ncbi:MAG: LysM peptidoglycan-binding domain-containing protein [Gemmatimonadota bacterium]|nr:MAG: LysM peptidoglycan-binding domain-containing protein [Gemmatimonadota bacterium]
MRRTTIFRSNGAALVAATVVFVAAAVGARDAKAQEPTQLPEVHIVQTGETLWELAERYLADPFLWPEIYRINTDVVEDPHWIFPGEELRLLVLGRAVVEEVEVVGQPVEPEEVLTPPTPVAPPPPPTETAPTVFRQQRPDVRSVDTSAPIFRYRPLRRGEFYAAGFLTEEEPLPWARVLGATGKPTLSTLEATSEASLFGEIEVVAPQSAAYQIGDSLLVARLAREVNGWGDAVIPTGIVRVTAVAGSMVRAQVITQFARVTDGQVALPLEEFDDPGDLVPVPIENGAEGEVIEPRDLHPVRQQQDVVFIDLGREDGVSLGDVFEVYNPVKDDPLAGSRKPIGILSIVHVRNHSASGFVVNVMDLGIDAGATVRLVRKMPG